MKDKQPSESLMFADLRTLLDDAYGEGIPVEDHAALIIALDEIGASTHGIVELVATHSRRSRGLVINDVLGLLSGQDDVGDADVSRVRKHLERYAHHDLPKLPWTRPPRAEGEATDVGERQPRTYEPISEDQSEKDVLLPEHLRSYWSSLEREFPDGLEDPRDYVALVTVLAEELSNADIWLLITRLYGRPKHLVMADLANLGTILVAPEDYEEKIRAALSRGGP